MAGVPSFVMRFLAQAWGVPRSRAVAVSSSFFSLSRRQGDAQKRCRPHVLAYCVVTGVIATTAGAVVSLVAVGTARIGAWAAVLVSVSVGAGLAYDSGPVNALWFSCRDYLHRVVGL